MATYLKCKNTGEFIPKNDWEDKYGKVPKRTNKSAQAQILSDFVSPIDGTAIGDYKQLRKHNEKHGVTNIADYSPGYFEKRGAEMKNEATGNTAEAKKERCQLIDKTLNDYGV